MGDTKVIRFASINIADRGTNRLATCCEGGYTEFVGISSSRGLNHDTCYFRAGKFVVPAQKREKSSRQRETFNFLLARVWSQLLLGVCRRNKSHCKTIVKSSHSHSSSFSFQTNFVAHEIFTISCAVFAISFHSPTLTL